MNNYAPFFDAAIAAQKKDDRITFQLNTRTWLLALAIHNREEGDEDSARSNEETAEREAAWRRVRVMPHA